MSGANSISRDCVTFWKAPGAERKVSENVLYTLQSTSYFVRGSTAGESFGSVEPMELVPSDYAAYLSPALLLLALSGPVLWH